MRVSASEPEGFWSGRIPDLRVYGPASDPGKRVIVPARWTAVATGDPLPYKVTLLVAYDGDAPPYVTSAEIEQTPDGPPVNGDGVRQVPFAWIVRQSIWLVAMTSAGDLPPGASPREIAFAGVDTRTSTPTEADEVFVSTEVARQRHRLNPERLREVAAVYTQAAARPARGRRLPAPVETIAEHYAITRKTASNWVVAARSRTDPQTDRPYLAPAQRGKTTRKGADK